jgi:Tfp pilus assembly protein PilX
MPIATLYQRASSRNPRTQRGVATLVITLSLLVILTIIVLASSSIGLFEQKTGTNDNRARLAQQAAEYALNIGGEYLKANVVNIASNEDSNGWLTSGGTNLHWQSCAGITDTNHPCFAEPVASRRSQLYYYTTDGTAVTDSTSAKLDLPTTPFPSATNLTAVGGTSGTAFTVTTTVHALLCRLDTTAGSTASCQATPSSGNRVAVTLLATSSISGESANAVVKETWGTYNAFNAAASVPLVAAGLVKGLGNASIVTAPNAGGYGLPGSVWSPNQVDVDGSGCGGVGSVTTCHLGDYLGTVPVADLETTCAGSSNTGCGCSNVAQGSPDMLSGHFGGSYKQESSDILDVDSNHGSPDIQFFPGKNEYDSTCTAVATPTCMDNPADSTDDNLFEWIFQTDVTSGVGATANTCNDPIDYAKEDSFLDGVGGTDLTTSGGCSSLNSASSGLYYMENTDTSTCSFGSDVGSPDNPVVVVVNGDTKVNGNFNFFGMLFVRDVGSGASLKGTGNVNVFGSVVVDGDVDVAGGFSIIYVDTSTGTPGSKLPATTRFGRLPGSWLDNSTGF